MIEQITLSSEQDGLELSLLLLSPDAPKGIVQFSHGMSEHKERYLPFMEFLCEKGYACVIHDHRGHGASVRHPDDLGYFYTNGAEHVILDLHQVSLWAKKRYPSLPLYLFGHSMGSLIVRNYIKRFDDEIDGLIVCGSPSKNILAKPARAWIRLMAKRKGEKWRSPLIQKLIFGSYQKGLSSEKSENAWICSDPAVVSAYDESELCGFIFTLNGFESLLTLLYETYHAEGWQMKNPGLPVLFLEGWEDPCRGNDKKFLSAVRFLQNTGYRNISFQVYGGARHELLNERQKELVFLETQAWLEYQHFCSSQEK